MNIYILDKACRAEGYNRNWAGMLSRPYELFNDYQSLVLNPDDFVIIHRSDFESGNGIDPELTKKLQQAKCLRLFISGGRVNAQKSSDGRGYLRSTPVDYPDDRGFTERLKALLGRLDKLLPEECPPWDIIEPEVVPENMLALYLLLVALEKNALDRASLEKLGGKLGDEFWENIQTELMTRGKKLKIPSSWVGFLGQSEDWVPTKKELSTFLSKADGL